MFCLNSENAGLVWMQACLSSGTSRTCPGCLHCKGSSGDSGCASSQITSSAILHCLPALLFLLFPLICFCYFWFNSSSRVFILGWVFYVLSLRFHMFSFHLFVMCGLFLRCFKGLFKVLKVFLHWPVILQSKFVSWKSDWSKSHPPLPPQFGLVQLEKSKVRLSYYWQ